MCLYFHFVTNYFAERFQKTSQVEGGRKTTLSRTEDGVFATWNVFIGVEEEEVDEEEEEEEEKEEFISFWVSQL